METMENSSLNGYIVSLVDGHLACFHFFPNTNRQCGSKHAGT